jgi:hypothetical protein
MFVFILKNAVSLFLNTSKNLSYVISKNSRSYSSLIFQSSRLCQTVVSIAGCKDMYSFSFCNAFLKEILKNYFR